MRLMLTIVALATLIAVSGAHWGGGGEYGGGGRRLEIWVALGDYNAITSSLTEAERIQLYATLESNRQKAKSEVKTALADFASTLPVGAELQVD